MIFYHIIFLCSSTKLPIRSPIPSPFFIYRSTPKFLIYILYLLYLLYLLYQIYQQISISENIVTF